jgi:hypothetical protein
MNVKYCYHYFTQRLKPAIDPVAANDVVGMFFLLFLLLSLSSINGDRQKQTTAAV